jgi:Putative peptidoglycan binding domain
MQRMRIKRLVMLILAGFVLTCPARFQAFGQDLDRTRATLRGLQGVGVLVERIAPDAERDGLARHQVQTDVELRLRQTGIRVLSHEERRTTPGRPYLYINVNAHKRNDLRLYTYSVSVELAQDVQLDRDLAIEALGVTTWYTGMIGSVGVAKIREAREDVLDHVDKFVNAYLTVNPEQAGAGRRSRGPDNPIPEASIIRSAQWQLQEAGLYLSAIDGKLGMQTRLALRQYQARQGLPTTGEMDEATSRALGLR